MGGNGKSQGKGKFRVKGTGKGKSRGNGAKKKAFSDLSDDRKEKILARHEQIHEAQGRELGDDTIYTGEVLQRGKRYGWIKPSAFGTLPGDVQAKVKQMCNKKKQIVKQNDDANTVFNQNVLFMHMSDVEQGVAVKAGDKVNFKVYTDNDGAGAHEVTTA